MTPWNLSRFALIFLLSAVSITLLIRPVPTASAVNPAHDDLVRLATELELTPTSLVVADVAGAQTTAVDVILGRLYDAESLATALEAQHNNAAEWGAAVTECEGFLQVDSADQDFLEQYNSAVAGLNSATSQVATIRADLLDLALDEFPTGQVEALATWRSSLAYDVPASFRVAERTDDEWQAIVSALRAEQRALRRGEEFTGSQAALLASVRSEPVVIAAENRLTTYLASVEQAFAEFEPVIE